MSNRWPIGTADTAFPVTVTMCCVVALFEGIDLQAAGVAAPKLGPAFGMTAGQLGWFFSASTFGLMIGAAIGGRLSDRFGRKTVLIAAVAAFGLMSLANGAAVNVATLLIARFLTGIGLGGALPNLLALAAENAPPARRNTAVAVLYAGLPCGGAVASLVSFFGSAENWRAIFFIGGVAPLLIIPLLIFALPDSRELAPDRAAGRGARGFAFALAGEGRSIPTLLLWVASFLGLMTMYILLNWLPTLLVGRGLSRPDASLVQLAFNLCGVGGGVAAGLLLDRFALVRVIPAAFLLAAVALTVLGLAPVALGVSLIVGGLVGGAINAAQALLYTLGPSTYPTAIRGTGVGSAVAVGRLGSAMGPLLAAGLLGAGRPPQLVLMVLVPIVVAAGAAAFILALARGAAVRVAMTAR